MSKDISILFSGGPDSTLATLYALQKADRVHLHTYHHLWMSMTSNHKKVIAELREKFGAERIVEHEAQIDTLFKKCYFTGSSKRLKKYRTFYIPWICGACKLAMHATTIAYNRLHDIDTTYDGANVESSAYFAEQTDSYYAAMKEFYRSIGMQCEHPVYQVERTDIETEKFGLITTKNTKKEHVFFSTQHTCPIGLLVHAHARLYYRPFRGKNRLNRFAGEVLEQTIADCRSFFP